MKFIAAVDRTTGEIQNRPAPPPYDVVPGLSPTQVRRVYDRQPDLRTEKDDGAGNLIAKSQAEIDAHDKARKDAEADAYLSAPQIAKPLKALMREINILRKRSGMPERDWGEMRQKIKDESE